MATKYRIVSPVELGSFTIDGYTIDLSAGATIDQVLTYNGTSFVAEDGGGGGFTLPVVANLAAIGTAQTPGLTIENTTAAISGSQQYSPMIVLTGQVYQTTGAASTSASIAIQARGDQDGSPGAHSPAAMDLFQSNGNNGTSAAFIRFGALEPFYTSEQSLNGLIISADLNGSSLGPCIAMDNGVIYFAASPSSIRSGSAWTYMDSSFISPFTDLGQTLGNATHRWSTCFTPIVSDTTSVTLTAGSTSATLTSSGFFQPSIDLDFGLGSTSKRWYTVFSPVIYDTTSVTLHSAAGDNSSAVAAIVDTTSAWSTSGSKLLSIRNNGVEEFFFDTASYGYPTLQVPGTIMGMFNSNVTGLILFATYLKFEANGTEVADLKTTGLTFLASATGLVSSTGAGFCYTDEATGFKAGYGSSYITTGGSVINLNSNANSVIDASGGTLGNSSHPWSTTYSPIIQDATSVKLLSSNADGASAVAAIIDTTTAWNNAASKLLSIRNDGTEQLYVHSASGPAGVNIITSTNAITLGNAAGDNFNVNTGLAQIVLASVPQYQWYGSYFINLNGTASLGLAAYPWTTCFTPIVENSTSVSLLSSHADGSSAVAAIIDTTSAWSTTGAKLLSIRTGGTEQLSIATVSGLPVIATPLGGLSIADEYGDRFIVSGGVAQIQSGSYATATFYSNQIIAQSDNHVSLGNSSYKWSNTWSYLYSTVVGSPISSTGSNITIAPTAGIHHVTGTGTIQTITPPVTGFIGSITLIPDGYWFTTAVGGNIGRASSAALGMALIMTYDGTSWYPSY